MKIENIVQFVKKIGIKINNQEKNGYFVTFANRKYTIIFSWTHRHCDPSL